MSLWRRIRDESAGAWRSLGYDLGRRPVEPAGGPDVTSTGMSTFPGSLVDIPVSQPEIDARPPRRFVAVTTFCLLAALGAGGSYLAATSVFAEQPSATADSPAAAPAPGSGADEDEAGMGSGPVTARRAQTVPPVEPAAGTAAGVAGDQAVAGATAPRAAAATQPGRTAPKPATGPAGPADCDCVTPPVPTPTAPSVTPSAGVSPSPSETAVDPSADPGTSGEPHPSADPSESTTPAPDSSTSDRRHHRRHRH